MRWPACLAAIFLCGSALAEVELIPHATPQHLPRTGARGDRWLPETMGSGVVVADFDADGHLDLLLLDGQDWGAETDEPAGQLFLGRAGLRFERSPHSVLPGRYGFGGVAGDLDADGLVDLIVTTLDGSYFLRGHGDGGFGEAKRIADGWGTSVCLADFDADGLLDVFVGRYVQWAPDRDLWCTLDGEHKSYCTPEVYEPSHCVVLRNTGQGGFEPWVELPQEAKALGVVAADMNDDGWTDVLVANDTMPDLLYLNQGGEGFLEDGLRSGVALSSTGRARGGMGVDLADLIVGEGLDIAIGHFAGESLGFYRNAAGFGFLDEAQRRGLDAPTRPELTFGLLAVDLDLDGHAEIITANGHIEPEVHLYRPGHSWKQRLGIYTSTDGLSYTCSPSPEGEWVGRGLAHGDFDEDGDADLILTQNGGEPVLFENRSDWKRVLIARGLRAGSTLHVKTQSRDLRDDLRIGHSYLSCSEAVLRFGLAEDERVIALELVEPGNKSRRIEIEDDGRRILEWKP